MTKSANEIAAEAARREEDVPGPNTTIGSSPTFDVWISDVAFHSNVWVEIRDGLVIVHRKNGDEYIYSPARYSYGIHVTPHEGE